MGVGKSSVGKLIAANLGIPFLDTDNLIVEKEELSINEIFSSKGETYFRTLETKVLIGLDTTKSSIIGTGGGLPMTGSNMEYMKENGVVVYLKDELDPIVKRLFRGRHKRPAIKSLDIDEIKHKLTIMLENRTPIYEQAHLTFERSEDRVKDANQLSTYLKIFA